MQLVQLVVCSFVMGSEGFWNAQKLYLRGQPVLGDGASASEGAFGVSNNSVKAKGVVSRWKDLPLKATKASWVEGSLLFCISVLAAMVYAIAGLGHALIFHSLCIVVSAAFLPIPSGGVQQATIYIMIYAPVMNVLQLYSLRTMNDYKMNIPFTLVYGGCGLLGMLAGMTLFIHLSESSSITAILEAFLFLACFMTVVSEGYRRFWKPGSVREAPSLDMKKPNIVALVVLFSLQSGFFQGTIGIGGATKVLMIVTLNIGKDEWRTTQCVADFPLQLTRLVLSLINGFVNLEKDWLAICFIFSGMGLGLVLGNKATKHVSQELFLDGLLVVICISSAILSARFVERLFTL